jgi:hypothetical protein
MSLIVAVEHAHYAGQDKIMELHCDEEYAIAVERAIWNVTGKHPVRVPFWELSMAARGQVAFFTDGLSLEEACALLRLVTVYNQDIDWLTRDLIAAEVILEHQDQEKSALILK